MKKWSVGLTLLLMMGAGPLAYHRYQENHADRVETVRVTRGLMTEELRVTGRIEAEEAEIVRAPEAFRIVRVLVEEGEAVKAGQELLAIDRADREDAVKRAGLNLEQAGIALEEAAHRLSASDRVHSDPTELEMTLRSKEAAYEEAAIARETAERELSLSRELYDAGLEALLNLKAKEDRLRAARVREALKEREYREAEELFEKKEKTNIKLAAVRGEYEIARRKQALAEAELRLCRDQLARLSVSSSMAGEVVSVQVEEGMFVSPGQELLTVADLGRLQVRAEVDELDAGRVKRDQDAVVTFDGFPGTQWAGRVETVAPQAVLRDGRAVVETIILLDEDEGVDWLRIANQVDVRIVLRKKTDVLQIPLQAVLQGEPSSVSLYENGVARMREVVVGFSNLDRVEIQRGLKEGDEVIIPRNTSLKDGERVRSNHSK